MTIIIHITIQILEKRKVFKKIYIYIWIKKYNINKKCKLKGVQAVPVIIKTMKSIEFMDYITEKVNCIQSCKTKDVIKLNLVYKFIKTYFYCNLSNRK